MQQGIDIKRGEGGSAIFPFIPLSTENALITEGDADIYFLELQEDGSLLTLDFDDGTFKETCVSPTTTASPQTITGAKATGIFTAVLELEQQSDFKHGYQYILYAEHDSMTIPYARWFQWGGVEGDQELSVDERVRLSPVGS